MSTLGEGGGRCGEAPLWSPVCPAHSPSASVAAKRARHGSTQPVLHQGCARTPAFPNTTPCIFAASVQSHSYKGSPRFTAMHRVYTRTRGRTRGRSYTPTCGHVLSHARACRAVLARPRLITTIQLAIEAKRFSGVPACSRPRWLPIHLSSSLRAKAPSVQCGG